MAHVEDQPSPFIQHVGIEVVGPQQLGALLNILTFRANLIQDLVGLFDLALQMLQRDQATITLNRVIGEITDHSRTDQRAGQRPGSPIKTLR